MKKGLLGSSALVAATVMMAGAAAAAEAPTWKLTGNANFQFYWVDQDWSMWDTTSIAGFGDLLAPEGDPAWADEGVQDHGWYFGVDEAELQLNVSGTADNGLNYGFKIEINANTTDSKVADEVRLQLSGGWGTLQMGDEDGAEDIMNYGGENLMGATGGFDGDQDDYIMRIAATDTNEEEIGGGWGVTNASVLIEEGFVFGAPSYPTIAGDTSDQTKISYFSPRFSGFQVGASLTPTPNNGDDFKSDGAWENHFGVGANYDNSFGDLRIRVSAVYSGASVNNNTDSQTDFGDDWQYEDISAWSVGAIVGWGPFSIGGNYTDNGDSGEVKIADDQTNTWRSAISETSYWNVAAGFETGPLYLSAGYFASTREWSADLGPSGYDAFVGDAEYTHIALTADYTVAPGLGVYAEINLIEDETGFYPGDIDDDISSSSNDITSVVIGANVSF